MGEKTPQQEIVELKAALRAANAENKTLKYIMEIIQEEYGEDVVKKYLPGLQLKKPPKKKTKVKVKAICKLFGICRQAYYKRIQASSRKKKEKKKIISLVKQQRVMMTRIGTRKLHYLIKPSLDREGIKCGRDKLDAILRHEGMLVRKKKNYMRTTNSYHRFYKYPNLIKDIHINRAEQVWVSDITYIRTNQGWLYLSLITDAYSKQIVGYQLSDNLKDYYGLNKFIAIIFFIFSILLYTGKDS